MILPVDFHDTVVRVARAVTEAVISTTTTTARTTTTITTSTTHLAPTPAPHTDNSSHVFLTFWLIVVTALVLVGVGAVALVIKTRWERSRLHLMPLYQFDPDQEDLEAELLDSPDRDATRNNRRRDFGTCQNAPPQLDLLEQY